MYEETELALTLVSWNQFEVGQVLVIPRRHAPTLLDLTNEEIAAVMDGVRRVVDAPVVTYDPDGLTLYQNNGVVSRQEVPHFHMHVGCPDEGVATGAKARRTSRRWRTRMRAFFDASG